MIKIDEIAFSAALAQAERLVELGVSPEDAAQEVCHGPWSEYRKRILQELCWE